jgi:hypothetical protein
MLVISIGTDYGAPETKQFPPWDQRSFLIRLHNNYLKYTVN